MDEGLRIAIIEPNEFLREVIFRLLAEENSNQIVYVGGSSLELIENLDGDKLDLLISSIVTSDINIIDLLTTLSRIDQHVKTVSLCPPVKSLLINSLLEKGVLACLNKEKLNIKELKSAISTVTQGKLFFNSLITKHYIEETWVQPMRIKLPNFTLRELEILECLCDGYSRNEISDRLFISLSTIKYHINKILDKSHTSSSFELVTSLYKDNWVFSIKLLNSTRDQI